MGWSRGNQVRYVAVNIILIVGGSWQSDHEVTGSLVDLLAGVITIAPSLTFALSGTSAFPGVLALAGSEPVLRFVDVAVNHKLSGFLILVPVSSIERLFVWEHLVHVIWVSLSGGGGDGSDNG